jgi:hypothetical protein
MTDDSRFCNSVSSALNILDRFRKSPVQSATFKPLMQKIAQARAGQLRKEAAKLTEVDVDVMEDIMRLAKKLGKGTSADKEDFENRLGLALRLLEMQKPTPSGPEMLVWHLNEIYKRLDWITDQERKRALKENGGAV